MRVFVYEFITGGGMLRGEPPAGSLRREGVAMLRAVIADLARIPGCDVVSTWDARLEGPPDRATVHPVGSPEEEQLAFADLAASADGVLVIAPEFDGLLLDRVRQVEEVGGTLLGPASDFVVVASDKNDTAGKLQRAGVRTPHGVGLRSGAPLPRDFLYPAVLKPADGAGSQDVFLIRDSNAIATVERELQVREAFPDRQVRPQKRTDEFPWRLEQYCPGMAASIALLCGPAGSVTLPACRQVLSEDGRFRYLGGQTPLPPELHARAASLAQRALDALPPAIGYIGFDLVLGAARDGSLDAVIEVNPRLTTSYVLLQSAVEMNLAELMLQTARSTLRVTR